MYEMKEGTLKTAVALTTKKIKQCKTQQKFFNMQFSSSLQLIYVDW